MWKKLRIVLSLAALLALGIFLSQWCQVEKEELVSAESQEFHKAVVTEISREHWDYPDSTTCVLIYISFDGGTNYCKKLNFPG